jgi:hypothetical protein
VARESETDRERKRAQKVDENDRQAKGDKIGWITRRCRQWRWINRVLSRDFEVRMGLTLFDRSIVCDQWKEEA